MPKRYVCTECGQISDKSGNCRYCGAETRKLKFEWTTKYFSPYILAAGAGVMLLAAYIFSLLVLIWLTFPLIAGGLLLDHLNQKEIDKLAKEKI